jgi:hypothetical protein
VDGLERAAPGRPRTGARWPSRPGVTRACDAPTPPAQQPGLLERPAPWSRRRETSMVHTVVAGRTAPLSVDQAEIDQAFGEQPLRHGTSSRNEAAMAASPRAAATDGSAPRRSASTTVAVAVRSTPRGRRRSTSACPAAPARTRRRPGRRTAPRPRRPRRRGPPAGRRGLSGAEEREREQRATAVRRRRDGHLEHALEPAGASTK